MSTSAIIVAAGNSRRMGFDKLSAELAGRSVLLHSILAFENCPAIDEIIVVTSPERIETVRRWQEGESLAKLAAVVEGGAERHLSVAHGLEAANPAAEVLAVHDGARPLVSPEAIARCVETAQTFGAAALAHPITDTLKRADAKTFAVTGSVDRENLWAMETPQAFAAALLREAYAVLLASGDIATDEVSAVEQHGAEVRLVENTEPNPKITFPGDIALAEAILVSRDANC